MLSDIDEWKGKTVEDIYGTTERAINNCADRSIRSFRFDVSSLGAGVTGDARKVNEERSLNHLQPITASPFNGASEVIDKDRYFIHPSGDMKGVKNGQFFYNYKAQSYWSLRDRFKKTYEMVEGIQDHPFDELISISSECSHLAKLSLELSQPTYKKSGNGKVIIDKAPDDSASPNLADCVMMGYAPTVNNDFSGLL